MTRVEYTYWWRNPKVFRSEQTFIRIKYMEYEMKQAVSIFLIGFFIRCVAAIVTTITRLNPSSQADAVGFGRMAEAIAGGSVAIDPYMVISGQLGIYKLWGSFLAPFWLIPGPSAFYARVANALLAAFAIYNVYLIARSYHSHQAGVIAVLPMIFYPSFIAVQSTLLRESIVLLGITTAARFLILPKKNMTKYISYMVAAIVLHLAYIQRTENGVIYLIAIASALLVHAFESGYLSKRLLGFAALSSPLAFAYALPYIRRGVDFLATTRRLRSWDRAVYLPGVIPQTILELIAFSWIGAAYLLYAPFPWMIQTVPDLIVSLEGIISIGFTIAAVYGTRSMGQKNTAATMGLLVGLSIALTLYGVGTANYGTGMRHRQMFIWVIFMFGGIGVSEYVRFRCRPGSEADEQFFRSPPK